MRTCGLLGLALAAIGLLLGLITWIMVVFVFVEYRSGLYWALAIADLLEMFCIFGGIGLACFGLMAAKK